LNRSSSRHSPFDANCFPFPFSYFFAHRCLVHFICFETMIPLVFCSYFFFFFLCTVPFPHYFFVCGLNLGILLPRRETFVLRDQHAGFFLAFLPFFNEFPFYFFTSGWGVWPRSLSAIYFFVFWLSIFRISFAHYLILLPCFSDSSFSCSLVRARLML